MAIGTDLHILDFILQIGHVVIELQFLHGVVLFSSQLSKTINGNPHGFIDELHLAIANGEHGVFLDHVNIVYVKNKKPVIGEIGTSDEFSIDASCFICKHAVSRFQFFSIVSLELAVVDFGHL